MKYWRCPRCRRMRFYSSKDNNLIIKICYACQVNMQIVEDKTLEAIQNG